MKSKALLALLIVSLSLVAVPQTMPPVSTFSIVAMDPQNGDLGIAVASRYFSVGSVVPWAMANVGAVATQANVNVGYGQDAIDLLRQGLTAPEVLKKIMADDKFDGKDGRQIAIVDAKGNVAAYTGPKAPNWAGHRLGKTWSAQGNILVGPQVPEAMGKAFESTQGELAEKLYAALKAGDAAGAMRAASSQLLSWLCANAADGISTTIATFTSTSMTIRTHLKSSGVCWI
jgi:uncharacterized Ntn-hydrolase superfamily protein